MKESSLYETDHKRTYRRIFPRYREELEKVINNCRPNEYVDRNFFLHVL